MMGSLGRSEGRAPRRGGLQGEPTVSSELRAWAGRLARPAEPGARKSSLTEKLPAQGQGQGRKQRFFQGCILH